MLSDCAFRAQLALPEQRVLFAYWHEIADGRAMPARADFDPLKFPHLLPHLGLIDLREGFDRGYYRLAGTRLRDIYGQEITGLRLPEVFAGRWATPWYGIHSRIATEAVCAQGVVRGPTDDREHVVLSWLRLPLSDDGVRVDRILCHDMDTGEADTGMATEFTAYYAALQEPEAARA
ncbi:hypothetical protein AUC68_08095 [Methyloceanibacter methanicus]|uniref:PAS domain-containing protein n=1 Tax=Methyloceanibacter methanicus TaxID=1774968 RepID=A0A1E3VXY0_9HYPH|nr:PAS domain-containing protein [Methyloceanibacter methanicus]ODR98394.1 hypothetical protein AUC68_08095 [Methyloceanibacter methanicus]